MANIERENGHWSHFEDESFLKGEKASEGLEGVFGGYFALENGSIYRGSYNKVEENNNTSRFR